MKRYHRLVESAKPLYECVIVAGTFEQGKTLLAKNRDRSYAPDVTLHHEIRNGVEVCYLRDNVTDWIEGMNEYRVGAVNTSLWPQRDDKEDKLVAKKGGTSQDGKRILRALEFTSIEDAVNSLAHYDTGVKGHTFIGNHKEMYRVETTGRHTPTVVKMTKPFSVRTNHGYSRHNIGYNAGEEFLSSRVRKSTIENVLTGDETPETLMKKLSAKHREENSLNPFRNGTDGDMFTTSQVVFDLDELVFYFRPVKDRCNFQGLKTNLPEDYTPKIKVEILPEFDGKNLNAGWD